MKILVIALCAMIIFASALFVFASLTSEFGGEKSDSELFYDQMDVAKVQAIIEVENDDYSVSLGERFTVRYRLQYVKNFIGSLRFESAFEFIDFAPFETDGEANIYHRKVGTYNDGENNIEIFEYTYEVKIFLVNGLVSEVYPLPSVRVDYVLKLGEGAGKSIDISGSQPMNVTRNVTNPELAELKDIKNSFDSNKDNIKNLFTNSARLLRVALFVFVALWVIDALRTHKNKEIEISAEVVLFSKFSRFKNQSWLYSAPAVQRLKELRALSMQMAHTFNKVTPLEFYSKFAVGQLWSLFNLTDSPKAEAEIKYSDVETAFEIIEKLLLLPKERTSIKRRVVRFAFVIPAKKLVQAAKFIGENIRTKKGGK